MKILVLTSRFPYPLEKGDKLRIFYQLQELNKRHEIILISLCDAQPSQENQAQVLEHVSKHYLLKISKWQRTLSLILSFFNGKPFQNAFFYSRTVQHKIDEIVKKEKPNFIHCHLIRMADYIRQSDIYKSLDYMDALSQGAFKRMQNSNGLESWFYGWEHKKTVKYEASVFAEFDRHFIISKQDRDFLEIAEKQRVEILSNGIDLEYFYPQTKAQEFDIGFVGNLGYYPNIRAVEFIHQQICPRLDQGTKVLFAGARPDNSILALENEEIEVKSWVEDIRTVYASVKIFVAPLFSGIGQQNKILEAMAMGIPVVTTSLVNNAIGAKDGVEILLADNPDDFVKHIKHLQNDALFYRKLRSKALDFVRSRYTWEQAIKPLLGLYET